MSIESQRFLNRSNRNPVNESRWVGKEDEERQVYIDGGWRTEETAECRPVFRFRTPSQGYSCVYMKNLRTCN